MGFFKRRKREPTVIEQAETVNDLLNTLGLKKHSEHGNQIRAVIALDLLSSEFESMKGYRATAFVKSQGEDVIEAARRITASAGIINQKQITSKKKK